jgi:hypothetical protein
MKLIQKGSLEELEAEGRIILKGKHKGEVVHIHPMKEYEGVCLSTYSFLTSVPYGGEWSASCPGRFTSKQSTPISTE